VIPTVLSPKVRVCVSLDQKVCRRLERFMAKAHHKAVSSAISELVLMGLAVYEMEDDKGQAGANK
jgi:metal-responsive CopG/Arc/MetJ family transcriptional regulator